MDSDRLPALHSIPPNQYPHVGPQVGWAWQRMERLLGSRCTSQFAPSTAISIQMHFVFPSYAACLWHSVQRWPPPMFQSFHPVLPEHSGVKIPTTCITTRLLHSAFSTSAFSMAPIRLFGEVAEEKRPITTPSRPTRNLVKFHLMLSLPRNPFAFDFKKT